MTQWAENMVLLLVSVDEVQKLLARLVPRSHAAEHAACSGGSARLLNAAHDHAKMARFDDDGDALWLEHLREGERDLLGEALLDLETTSKHFGNAGEFGKADDAAVGNVANVHLRVAVVSHVSSSTKTGRFYLASERHQMVLAQGKDLNVSHNDQLVMVLVEDGAVDNVPQVLLVALCEEEQRLCVPLRRVQQSLAVGVFA